MSKTERTPRLVRHHSEFNISAIVPANTIWSYLDTRRNLIIVILVLMVVGLPTWIEWRDDQFTQEIRFAAMGDWGGQGKEPFTSKMQVAVAQALKFRSHRTRIHFFLSLGDNFLDHGIEGGVDGDKAKERFEKTFEKVYEGEEFDKPWYMSAGDHDHDRNVTAQLAYSDRSTRWKFPQLYYAFTKQIMQRKVMIVVTDSYNLERELNFVNKNRKKDSAYVVNDENAPQLSWLKETLETSTADWIVVCGHFPLYSIGEYGATAVLQQYVAPLLESTGVALYLSAHDRLLQHIKVNGSCVDHVGSGAGSDVSTQLLNKKSNPKGSVKMFYNDKPGFALVLVSQHTLDVKFVNSNGTQVHAFRKSNPREAGQKRVKKGNRVALHTYVDSHPMTEVQGASVSYPVKNSTDSPRVRNHFLNRYSDQIMSHFRRGKQADKKGDADQGRDNKTDGSNGGWRR